MERKLIKEVEIFEDGVRIDYLKGGMNCNDLIQLDVDKLFILRGFPILGLREESCTTVIQLIEELNPYTTVEGITSRQRISLRWALEDMDRIVREINNGRVYYPEED